MIAAQIESDEIWEREAIIEYRSEAGEMVSIRGRIGAAMLSERYSIVGSGIDEGCSRSVTASEIESIRIIEQEQEQEREG